MRNRRQYHWPQRDGADQRDADRLASGAAGGKKVIEVHGNEIRSISPSIRGDAQASNPESRDDLARDSGFALRAPRNDDRESTPPPALAPGRAAAVHRRRRS